DEQEIVTILEYARNEFIRRFDNFEFSQALETAWGIIARIDKMITDSKPWELAKNPQQAETLNAILYRAVETIRWLSVLLYPVLPEATCKIYRQIGFDIEPSRVNPEELRWGETPEGMRIQKVEPIFPRVDKSKIMSEIENSKIQVANPEIAEKQETEEENQRKTDKTVEEYISIDDFLKVELRVGEIKVAERVPNADKLLRFEVDIGEERPRQILAGLAQYYEPEKLIGRKVVVVANLKPRKMRGLESQGMICAASLDENDIPAIATFIEEVKNGARLK
ncbi:MAG: methionine--tRNA ligase subunit beta, partial [Acidobacteria bacterium]